MWHFLIPVDRGVVFVWAWYVSGDLWYAFTESLSFSSALLFGFLFRIYDKVWRVVELYSKNFFFKTKIDDLLRS